MFYAFIVAAYTGAGVYISCIKYREILWSALAIDAVTVFALIIVYHYQGIW
jgi:hypothetical protein